MASASSPASPSRSSSQSGSARSEVPRKCSRSSPAARSSSHSASSTTSSACIPQRSSPPSWRLRTSSCRAPSRSSSSRARRSAGRSGMLWLVGLTNAFNLLDNMDGLAGSLGVVAASCFALSAAFVSPNRDIFIIATALALALLGFIPYNLRPSGPARVFMGDSGSQLIGFVLASLGLMASYKEAGNDDRDRRPARADPRDPHPRHDPRHGSAAALWQIGDPGREGPHLAPARLLRALRAPRRALPRRCLGRSRSHQPRVRRARQRTHHGDRGPRHLRAPAPVAAFLSGAPAAPGESGLSARAGLLVDTLVDGALTVASFYAAYVIVVEGNGTPWQRHVFIWALPAVLLCRYVALRVFGLYRRGRSDAKGGTLARRSQQPSRSPSSSPISS